MSYDGHAESFGHGIDLIRPSSVGSDEWEYLGSSYFGDYLGPIGSVFQVNPVKSDGYFHHCEGTGMSGVVHSSGNDVRP